MKKLMSIAVTLTLVFFAVPSISQATTRDTGNIVVTASVPANLFEFTWGISKVDSKGTDDPNDDVFTKLTPDPITGLTTMDYGQLIHTLRSANPACPTLGTEAGVWFSEYYFAVFMSVLSTSGRQYTIKSESPSNGLYNAATKLGKGWGIGRAGCFNTTSSPQAYYTCPEGSELGTAGAPADSSTPVILYTSANPPTRTLTVRADYAIAPYKAGSSCTTPVLPFTGFEGVPLTQKSGAYSGTVKITASD